MTDTQLLTIVVAVCTLLVLVSLTGICWVLIQIRDYSLDYFAFEINETDLYHERRGEVRDESGRWVPRGHYWSEHLGQPVRSPSTTPEHTEDAPKVAQTTRQRKGK
jgi:hypothetical protein